MESLPYISNPPKADCSLSERSGEPASAGLQGASKVQLQVVAANEQWAIVTIVRNTPTGGMKMATVTMSYQMWESQRNNILLDKGTTT